jgi:hypothetical protein
MRDLQILIFDLVGGEIGELDLTDSDEFALKLTKSIASINDLGRRNTSFSLDFEAPQTKNNNKLLVGLRFIRASKEVLGKKACSIVVDGNQVDKGFLYPFESEFDGMYKLVFKGLNNDWVERLQDVELNQLKWLDHLTGVRSIDATELFSGARFAQLNIQNSLTADLIYPYINRNNSSAAQDLRSQIHLRSVILAMFAETGHTVVSEWLDSDWIKAGTAGISYTDAYANVYTHLGLSVDPVFRMTRDQQDLLGETIEYKTTGIAALIPVNWPDSECIGNLGDPPVASRIMRNLYRFPNSINTLIKDDNILFDTATSEYTVQTSGDYSVKFFFNYSWAYNIDAFGWEDYASPVVTNNDDYPPLVSTPVPPGFRWRIVKNNISNTSIDNPLNVLYTVTTGPLQRNVHIQQEFHKLKAGDKISVFLELIEDARGFVNQTSLNSPNALPYWKLRINNGSVLQVVPNENVTLNDTFRINSHIPEGIKCLELLQNFKTMFNLYFDVDVNRKTVFIEPRDEFYSTDTVDITKKIDFNTPPKLNYLTSYKNEIVFEYKKDTNDKYLEQWNKINDKTYGQLKYKFGNDDRFEKGQSKLSTSLISATIQGELEGTANIMTSIIKPEYLDANNLPPVVNQNYGARVFQLVRGEQYDTAGIQRRLQSPFTVLVGIMENYGNTPTLGNRRLTFDAENGLVWNYYRKTLANIEDTAILTVKLNLSLYDFNSWDLKKQYYISEPAEIAGYYITDSIKNFNVTKDTPTTVTLVKFKDYTPVTIPGGIGNVVRITQNNPQPQEIMVEVNGAIVSCLDNNNNKIYKV